MKGKLKERVIEAKKTAILEEVSKLFEKENFHKLKMQDISKYLQISVGALYKLFPSKDALFHSYVEYQIKIFYEKLKRECIAISDPKKCLLFYIELKFKTFKDKRKSLEDPITKDPLFFMKLSKTQSPSALPVFELLGNIFENLNQEIPINSDNYLKTAYIFNAYTTGYIEYWMLHETDLKEDAIEILDNFLYGIIRKIEEKR